MLEGWYEASIIRAVMRWLIPPVLAVVAVGAGLDRQAPRPQARLVVLLVVDQMRADYVEAYGHQWTRGLRRLFDRGARFTGAEYPYYQTATCPGHATIATGAFPYRHGLILNGWRDRASGESVTCTHDPSSPLIPYGGGAVHGGASPAGMLTTTLGDELYARFGEPSRSFVVSLKARSAVPMAGRRAGAVVWLNEASRQWVTSRTYGDRPPAFLAPHVAFDPWRRAGPWARRLSPKELRHEDDAAGERPPPRGTNTFPHAIDGDMWRWMGTPFSDAHVATLALAAIEKLELGRDDVPDFLAVGFSALDLVGHRFGPRSHEVQELLAGLDETIGRLLDGLDRHVGAPHYAVGLSSDHGVSPIPEQAIADGQDAGRIPIDPIGARLDRAISAHLGRGRHVAWVHFGDVYLRPGVADALLRRRPARDAVLRAAEQIPGIRRAFLGSELSASRDPDARTIALSYHPDRSGELILVPRPNWAFVQADTPETPVMAATHGTMYPYDARVPLVLMGAGIAPGTYTGRVSPADLAPTLAALAGITLPPPRDGRVLHEALAR